MRYAFALMIAAVGGLISLAGCDRRGPIGPTADAKEVAAIREKLVAGAAAPAAGGADSGEAAASTGWASITGTVKYVGTPPTPSKPNLNAECAKHPVVDESIVVGSDGGLQNVVVFLRTPKPQIHPDYADLSGKSVVLDNKDCRFEPHVAVVQVGQNLSVKNSDPFGHNTNISPKNNPQVNPILPAGSTLDQKFNKEEQLPVKVGCNIHAWMGAWLVVREDPYAAASDKSGAFALKNLPAGRELEFQLWQEKAGFLKGVEVSGAPIKVDAKGRFKVKLEPDKDLALVISVPADAIK